MKVLSIGTDVNILNPTSDAARRMTRYGQLVDRWDIVVVQRKAGLPAKSAVLGTSTYVHPVYVKFGPLAFLKALFAARKIAGEQKPDVVIGQDPLLSGLLSWLVAKRCGAKLLVSVYGPNVHDPFWKKERVINSLLSKLGQFILSRSAAIMVDGQETFRDLSVRYPGRVFLKPLVPFNIDSYYGAPHTRANELRVLFAAKMVAQKNIHLLAEVIKGVLEKKPAVPIRFTVVGSGPDSSVLSKLLAEHPEFSDRVTLMPHLAEDKLPEVYHNHDTFVLTSIYEGFPRVFMFAAAAGLPVVTTEVSGALSVVVEGESGFIVPQGDAAAIVARLCQLAADRELLERMSARTTEDFKSRYSFEETIATQKKIFDFLDTK